MNTSMVLMQLGLQIIQPVGINRKQVIQQDEQIKKKKQEKHSKKTAKTTTCSRTKQSQPTTTTVFKQYIFKNSKKSTKAMQKNSKTQTTNPTLHQNPTFHQNPTNRKSTTKEPTNPNILTQKMIKKFKNPMPTSTTLQTCQTLYQHATHAEPQVIKLTNAQSKKKNYPAHTVKRPTPTIQLHV
jgi:hypothetical protein